MEECVVAVMAQSHAVHQQTEEAGFVETVAHLSVECSQSSLQDILLPLPIVEYGIQREISVGRHTDVYSRPSAYTSLVPRLSLRLAYRAGQRSYVKLLRGRREEPGNEASLYYVQKNKRKNKFLPLIIVKLGNFGTKLQFFGSLPQLQQLLNFVGNYFNACIARCYHRQLFSFVSMTVPNYPALRYSTV